MRRRIGVGVEVDEADVAAAEGAGDGGGAGEGDGVVAAQDDGYGAGAGDFADLGTDGIVGALDVAGDDLAVAVVEDLEELERLDVEVEVVGGAAEVGGLTDGTRAEAGAGPVRRCGVCGRADDDDVGALAAEVIFAGEEGDAHERRDADEGGAVVHAVVDHGGQTSLSQCIGSASARGQGPGLKVRGSRLDSGRACIVQVLPANERLG
jgi:hypothetical protein